MYTIQQIEDAIISTLKASGLASLSPTIDSYHGEIDDLIREVQELIVPMPATFVMYVGSTFEESANRSYDEYQTFTVVFVAQDLRGGTGPGGGADLQGAVYPMIEAGKAALKDNSLGLNIEPLQPIRVAADLIAKTYSVFSMDIKTSFSMD